MISFARVHVAPLAAWLMAIPYTDWPQQHRLADGQLRPAMVTDLGWHGFGEATDYLVTELLAHFRGRETWRALSAVMPGQAIPSHRDEQPDAWVTRVHVPILSNPDALFIVEDVVHRMMTGRAYKVDTRELHSVVNAGSVPRVHFMLDISQP